MSRDFWYIDATYHRIKSVAFDSWLSAKVILIANHPVVTNCITHID